VLFWITVIGKLDHVSLCNLCLVGIVCRFTIETRRICDIRVMVCDALGERGGGLWCSSRLLSRR